MQIHQLQPKHVSKGRKIVGRGGKKGTYSGKGGKGQTARAGHKLAPIIRELIKRYPKLKGYRAFSFENDRAVVNLSALEKHFGVGETVSPKILVERGLVKELNGKTPAVKILGAGSLSKKITIEGCVISASAKVAVEKAGGSVKLL